MMHRSTIKNVQRAFPIMVRKYARINLLLLIGESNDKIAIKLDSEKLLTEGIGSSFFVLENRDFPLEPISCASVSFPL